MKKRYIYYIKVFTLATVVTLSTACKKTLEIAPQDSVSADVALTDRNGVEAAIVTLYATLKGENFYGNRLIGLGEALADNGRSTNKSGRYVSESTNVRGTANASPYNHYSHWSGAYVAINRINLTLETIPGIVDPTFTEAQKNAYIGELKFLRALYYFDLVRAYAYIPGADVPIQNRGGVPLILKSTTTIEGALTLNEPRAPITAVYDQIYTDLDDAVAKLGNITTNPSRATKQGAQALYSRVALYRKDWTKTVSLSSDVITSIGGRLLNPGNYVAGFTAAVNPESVFEVAFVQPGETLGVNVSLQTLFTGLTARVTGKSRDSSDNYTGRPASLPKKPFAGFGDLVPTSTLLSALGMTVTNNGSNAVVITARSTDVRNEMFEVGPSSRTPVYVECTKFLGRSATVNVDNVPVIRVAEMYLNRAEAYQRSGNDVLALADVNTIRVARGLPALVAGTVTGTALFNEILAQRRLEFAFEGQRFFDLKRNGLDIVKPVSNTTLAFDNSVLLPPIPQADVDASQGKLLQNPGY
ncbi:RagB/SusD family nutrient uptake outer membrane protein [Mucilaginibacter sp. PAMB04274]|uniref:RagB/SusD family nutrient uptake outer membrane protein n=1 Tax=Mucilaginibacter sp. PAMB04274 TaxID=3138568 RepID=UPI0031F5FF91